MIETNILLLYQDKNYAIKLKPSRILYFNLVYNQLEYYLRVLKKYIDENLYDSFI